MADGLYYDDINTPNDYHCSRKNSKVNSLETIEQSKKESFGNYTIKYVCSSDNSEHIVILEWHNSNCSNTNCASDYATLQELHFYLEGSGFEWKEMATKTYNLLRDTVKHAAHQIAYASVPTGFGSCGSAPQML